MENNSNHTIEQVSNIPEVIQMPLIDVQHVPQTSTLSDILSLIANDTPADRLLIMYDLIGRRTYAVYDA